MQHHYSRREKTENKLYQLAEEGNYISNNDFTLYKGEIQRFRKKGFKVTPSIDSDKEVPCIIEWSSPFPKGIPLIVVNYTTNQINTFPKGLNLAQELYTIAARKNNE